MSKPKPKKANPKAKAKKPVKKPLGDEALAQVGGGFDQGPVEYKVKVVDTIK